MLNWAPQTFSIATSGDFYYNLYQPQYSCYMLNGIEGWPLNLTTGLQIPNLLYGSGLRFPNSTGACSRARKGSRSFLLLGEGVTQSLRDGHLGEQRPPLQKVLSTRA